MSMQVHVRAQFTAIYRLQLERAFVIIPDWRAPASQAFWSDGTKGK